MKNAVTLLFLLTLPIVTPVQSQGDFIYTFKMAKPRPSPTNSYQDLSVKITFVITRQVGFRLENKTGSPIEIDWNHASFIDFESTAHRVMHEGVRYIERDKPLASTVVPPGANVTDVLIPVDSVYYESGIGGGWKTVDTLPVSLRLFDGKTIGIYLPLKIGTASKNYLFSFRVEKDLEATSKFTKEQLQRINKSEFLLNELHREVIAPVAYPHEWPFTPREVILACSRNAVFVIANDVIYAINSDAHGAKVDGKPVSINLAEIENQNAKSGFNAYIDKLIIYGLKLCN